MEPDARKQVDFRSKRRAGSPKRPSAGKLFSRYKFSLGKKKCSSFIFLPLIMNKLLSSPLGTKEQNSKEECRRHFLWMSATDPERKETQSRQVRVWLSAWSIKSVSPGAVRHPLGPKIHHLRKGETAGAWLGELVQKGPGRRSGRSGSGHGRCLSPWPGTAALHGRFPRT